MPDDICAELDALAQPTAAEMAAAVRGALTPASGPTRPANARERERLAQLCAQLGNPSAAAEWEWLSKRERALLVIYGGLRESNPGLSPASMAERGWEEFPPGEQLAIGQAVRLLMRRLARLTAIGRMR